MNKGITLTDAQIERLSAIYADTTNKDICAEFQISLSTLYKYAKKLGLSKSQEFMDKAKSGKMNNATESKTDNAAESKKYFRFRDRWKKTEVPQTKKIVQVSFCRIKKKRIIYTIDKIENKVLFRAVAYAVDMIRQGKRPALANSIAAATYGFTVKVIAHYTGQRAQRMKQYRNDNTVILYDTFTPKPKKDDSQMF